MFGREPLKILITGCASGIGRALASEFHRRGHRVFASARRVADLKGRVAEEITALPLDVCDDGMAAVATQRLEREGGLDVLINNAGFAAMGPLLELDRAALLRQLDVNSVSPLMLARAFAPQMIARGGGRIVNIGSVSGILVSPFAGAYGASKAALHAFNHALRLELAPFGISVIGVEPGAVRSGFGDRAVRELPPIDDASPYAAVREAVAARASASQKKPTSTEAFARWMASAVLKPKPQAILRYGRGSTIMPLLARWMPLPWRDALMARRFSLHRLSRRG